MKTVYVGLSGGVDSAVSAHLLKEAGHNVVGVFLKVWEPDFLPCTGAQDRLDAMRVAAHLQIPFKTYDVEEEYKNEVVEYLLSEYKAGRTPNPDVMCNRSIKFGAFWEKAKKDGADFIATGHYAQNKEDGGAHTLLRGIDEGKDQSYFLWTLTQDDLVHSLFPIGGIEKREVRKIADTIGLPNATKKDSQGICFLGHVDMAEFLKRYISVEEGVVRDIQGNEVGKHSGVAFYTLGQHIATTVPEKMYIVKKDQSKNELIVSDSATVTADIQKKYVLDSVSWTLDVPQTDKKYHAQTRYHGTNHPVEISLISNEYVVTFDTPVLIAEGQSVVIYDNDRCVGGGIARVYDGVE